MEYFPSPQDQKRFAQKPLYRNRVFISLFALSLSLNLYFFHDRGGEFIREDQMAATVNRDSGAIEAPVASPVSQERPVAAKIKKVAYSKPDKFGGQEIRVLNFEVENSLNYTLCKYLPKEECGLMTAYMGRILAWHFELNKYLRKGDSGYLIYKDVTGEERLRILKLSYRSQYLGKTLEINYFKSPDSKFGAYFDSEGSETAARISKTQAPLRDYSEITSLPGDFRKGARTGHAGTDFKTPVGAPVYASFDGQVTRINWNRRLNGHCVEIDHPKEKIKTLYLHLNKVLVRPGTKVKQGQRIGESGNTGRSFAPHLHYEIRSRDSKKTVYNPFTSKNYKTFRRKIPDEMMPTFRNTLKTYDTLFQNG